MNDRRQPIVMCKTGDIILVKKYRDGKNRLGRHSFIVIDDRNDTIEGMPYDMICNVLSSFKDEEQKKRKLAYSGNFPITHDDTVTCPDNGNNGYVKADQLYYFRKDKIEYQVIGNVLPDILELLFEFITESDFPITEITDNL